VEPKYEKKIETLDELLNSDVVYGYSHALHLALSLISHPELARFFELKERKEECSDVRKCVERMITKRDIAIINDPVLVLYLARKLGNVDVNKLICAQDETQFSGSAITLFKKGNPLLDRFNIQMRRYLEAGFLERLWTELKHRASLRREGLIREGLGDMFFAFSVSHLMPAFVVLLLGTVLSSAVFIGELIVNCLYKRRGKISVFGQ